ncbi:MAG: hypothetical protein GQ558_08375 [Thermoplasmata archaeon]|nr:hypothetical protein [Thermoplasmata archaeon]
MQVDRSPPDQPQLDPLPVHTQGSTVTVNWSAVADNPSNGCIGGVMYSIEGQRKMGGLWVTTLLTSWSDHSSGLDQDIDLLTDGLTYRFRIRSCDASYFESDWSAFVNTSMDASPPTTPQLTSLPQFTKGTSIELAWSASSDAGIGLPTGLPGDYPYQVQRSIWSDFRTISSRDSNDTQMTIADLSSNTLYYYRVRAQDIFNQWSEWSPIEHSTQDDDPPVVPVMVDEPLFTQGTTNTFLWSPSSDAASGLKDYWVQVSISEDFSHTDVVLDTNTTALLVEASDLIDDRIYYCRVKARDRLDHSSYWSEPVSSTQDATAPTGLAVDPLPEYSPAGWIDITWRGTVDDGSGIGWYKVEISRDPGFGTIEASYDQIIGSSFVYEGAAKHKVTVYFRVTAYDQTGNEGVLEGVQTTWDLVAPRTPVLDPLPKFTPGTECTVGWSAVADDGSGLDHYLVSVYRIGSLDPVYKETTELLSLTLIDLADGQTYAYRVTAVDKVGNGMTSAAVSSTQDSSPPPTPVMVPLEAFVTGPGVRSIWRPVRDGSGQGVEYQVMVYDSESPGAEPVATTPYIVETFYDHTGLTTDSTLYFRVVARDHLEFESEPSAAVSTMVDTIPPVASIDEVNIDGVIVTVKGTVIDAGSGVVSASISLNDGQWTELVLDGSKWSITWEEVPEGTSQCLVKAIDALGHECEPINGTLEVEADPPMIQLTSPQEGETVSGRVPIEGAITDPHLERVRIEYRMASTEEWSDAVPEMTTSGMSGLLGRWDASALANGEYDLRVTAVDSLGASSEVKVRVTIANVVLTIAPSDIILSNENPLPGEKITVFVTVHNEGGVAAENVIVKLLADGEHAGQRVGISIPAHGNVMVPIDFEAEDGVVITATAKSSLSETGEMDDGVTIDTREEEGVLETTGGILGLLALIVAVFVLVLVLVYMRRGGKEEVVIETEEEDIIFDPLQEEASTGDQQEPGSAQEEPPQRPKTLL